MARYRLVGMATAIAISCGSGAAHAEGHLVQATTKLPGVTACHAASDIGKLTKYATEQDKAAFLQFESKSIHDGRCIHLDGNQAVFVEKVDDDNKAVCVRPESQANCLWTTAGALEATPPK